MLGVIGEWGHKLRMPPHKKIRINLSYLETTHFEQMELQELPKIANSIYSNEDCQDVKSTDNENIESSEVCECRNCIELHRISECGVCLEPLLDHGIKSCPICFNLLCRRCASRIANCAFCRSRLPLQRNRAVEKLLSKLFLPCKNSRYGCEVILDIGHRFIHELVCNFSIVECPEKERCSNWVGLISEVISHMKNVHKLEAGRNNHVHVGISDFQTKANSDLGQQHAILLSYEKQLFFLKINAQKGIMIMAFTLIGYIEKVPVKLSSLPKYGVLLRIDAGLKNLKTFIRFQKFDYCTRLVNLKSHSLYTAQEDEDIVNIHLSVMKANEKCLDTQ